MKQIKLLLEHFATSSPRFGLFLDVKGWREGKFVVNNDVGILII